MIQIKDLRLGNWVHESECTRYPMYVHTIGEDYVYLNFDGNEGDVWECKPEELQGIPLTEDLLEKMGFWKIPKSNFYELQFYKDDTRDIRCAITVSLKVGLTNVTMYREPKLPIEDVLYEIQPSGTASIKYLHELQNLFKAIINDDLKIDIWN